MSNKQNSPVMTIAFLVISAALAFGAFVPLLVNVLVSGRLDWSLIPLGAIGMAYLILAPWFVLRRYRAAVSWGMAAISVPAFLYLVETLSPVRGWYLPLALPAALLGLAALGGIIWLWCYSPVHPWYAAACTFGILGLLTMLEHMLVWRFLYPDPYEWIRNLVAASLGGAAILLYLSASIARGRRILKNP